MNLQSQNATNVARRTALEALEKASTQWDNFAFPLIPFLSSTSTGSSSMEISILPGYIAQRIGNNSWFATSSKVTVILLQERKKVWVALQHRWTKWRRLNKSLYLDKQWDETMAFNTLACCNAAMKPMLDNFCPPIPSNPRRYPT